MDSLIGNIKDRFNQPTITLLGECESFLVKCFNDKVPCREVLESEWIQHYKSEINTEMLIPEILLCKENLSESIDNLSDITDFLAKENERTHIRETVPNLWKLVRLLNLFPATSAEAERSFSKMRILKTHLRSTMTTKRFNHLSILYTYKEELDKVNIHEIANSFVGSSEGRLNIFGKFTESPGTHNIGKTSSPTKRYVDLAPNEVNKKASKIRRNGNPNAGISISNLVQEESQKDPIVIKKLPSGGLESGTCHFCNSNPSNHYCRTRVKGSGITIEGEMGEICGILACMICRMNWGNPEDYANRCKDHV